MILIFGGAYQGKLEYAKKMYEIDFIDGSIAGVDEIYSAKGIYNFDKFIKRCMVEKTDMQQLLDELKEKNNDVVIVSTEVGAGIVPVDKNERDFREAVGRICTKIAANSIEVHRVTCGIGQVISKIEG